MIVFDFADRSPSLLEPAVSAMDGKPTDEKGARADSPDTDSARSTPEAGAEATGAIPKSRSLGRLDALRSSLRDVGKNSSFKLGRKKKEDGVKEEKKKSKKTKKKEAKPPLSPPEAAARAETPESTGGTVPSPTLSASAESLPTKTSKVSRTSSLVRKLSIGRYRSGKKQSQDSPVAKTLSPSSTSPELSPAASRTDVSDDEAPSVASSTSEGRQGPEGDDGEVFSPPSSASALTSPSPVLPPLSAAALGQSRLIAGGANKGSADQSQAPASRGAAASASSARQASRKDRDSTLESVPEAESHEEATAPPVQVQSSPLLPPPPPPPTPPPPSPPALRSPIASSSEAAPRSPLPPLLEDGAAGSSRVTTAAFMSQRLGSAAAPTATASAAAVDVATTKSQILSITTPAIKKQQALDEIRAASSVAPAPSASAVKPSGAAPPAASAPPPDEPEDEQFGDLEEDEDALHHAMSAPPPSAATVMAEARARLSQSLGNGKDGATLPVNEKREHLYKILVIGELGTGKTSIIKRYVHQFFSQHYRATIGVDFALKVLNWDANTVIRLQLWDIAGQERFGNMTRVYYKEAVGAFIVFDVTRAATFDAVIKWKQDLDAKVQLADGSPIPCVLLANKCDQQKEGIVNTTAKMDEYCKEKGFSAWFETSAKENINIEDAARCLVTKILQNDKLIHNESKDNDKFALDGKGQKDEKSGGKSCAC